MTTIPPLDWDDPTILLTADTRSFCSGPTRQALRARDANGESPNSEPIPALAGRPELALTA